MLIAKYIFDHTVNADALPTFNSGYVYTVEDTQYNETFDVHNNVLPRYYMDNSQYHSPIIGPNGTLIYTDSTWDWYSLDVNEYANKQVTVSFDVSCVNDEQTWRWCEGWSTGYGYNIAEGVSAGSEPKHISYTFTLSSNIFTIQGGGIKLSNIQIMVDGVNLFDILPGFNEYFVRDDFNPYNNNNTACKVNNELWFTYSPWCVMIYDISTLSGCDITVSFDIDKIGDNADFWVQFDHLIHNTNTDTHEYYTDIVGAMYGDITDTTHVEATFTLASDFKGLYLLEGMTGIVSNFKIEVQSPYITRSIYSDTSPTSITFNNSKTKTSCISVEYLDISNITSAKDMFNGCSKLTQLDISNFDTSKVTNMSNMFNGCLSLTQLDVSNFDTGNVKNMQSMFYGCLSLTQLDVSNFDTGNVTAMSYMFNGCSKLTRLDVSNFDTSNVENMQSMFYGCSSLTQLDVSNFDTGNVKNMQSMFNNCKLLTSLDISNFDTGNVTAMSHMFNGCSKLTQLDISNFDTSKVTNTSYMFSNCILLTSLDISNFDTSKVTNMSNMFNGCSSLTQLDVSNFDTSKVTTMPEMFNKATNLVNIGMIYCSLDTINKLSKLLPTTKAKQVYVHDVSSSKCTEVNNITFIDYIGDSEIITPPRTLLPGDEILWDDSSQRYIIKCSDGSTIQTDITSKFKIDLYTPYTMIYGDNATSISVNINRKEM